MLFAVLFSSLISFVMIFWARVMLNYDSYSYINAIDNLTAFQLDPLRTPVYPLLLAFSKLIFGECLYLWAVIVIQHAVFVLSVFYLAKMITGITRSAFILYGTVFIYNLGINMLGWNNMIMTESLATSGMTVLLAVTFDFLHTKKNSDIFKMSFLIAALIFHRPIFVYLLPVYMMIMLSVLCGKWKKPALKGFVSLTIVGILVVCYMLAFKHSYGVIAMSNVSIFNNIFIAREAQLITPENVDDPALSSAIAQHYKDYGGTVDDKRSISYFCEGLVSNIPLPVLQRNVNNVIYDNKTQWVSLTWKRFVDSFADSLFPLGQSALGFIPMGVLYLLLFAFFIALVLSNLGDRNFLWLILLLELTNIATAIVGAQDACNRLVIPSIAIPSIMTAYIMETIRGLFIFHKT